MPGPARISRCGARALRRGAAAAARIAGNRDRPRRGDAQPRAGLRRSGRSRYAPIRAPARDPRGELGSAFLEDARDTLFWVGFLAVVLDLSRARPRRVPSRRRASSARARRSSGPASGCRWPASSPWSSTSRTTGVTASGPDRSSTTTRRARRSQLYFTAYLVEYSLSLDNIVVIALIFTQFGVPLVAPAPRALLGRARRDRDALRLHPGRLGAARRGRLDPIRLRRAAAARRRAHAVRQGRGPRAGEEPLGAHRAPARAGARPLRRLELLHAPQRPPARHAPVHRAAAGRGLGPDLRGRLDPGGARDHAAIRSWSSPRTSSR